MVIKNKGEVNKKMTLCVGFNFAQSFLYIKLIFSRSYLAVGEPVGKVCPVDCEITEKNKHLRT